VFLNQSGKVSDRLCNGTILILVEKANNVMIQVEVEFLIVDFRSGEVDWKKGTKGNSKGTETAKLWSIVVRIQDDAFLVLSSSRRN
jgi:hypothetical protein